MRDCRLYFETLSACASLACSAGVSCLRRSATARLQRTRFARPVSCVSGPITMTTLAAMMGTLPLAMGIGAGSELRQPLGVAVVGGLIFSQAITLYITPVLFLYLESLRRKSRRAGDSGEIRIAPTIGRS